MTDEIKEIKHEECFCKSKGFRSFLVVSLGTFTGVFCAISLFAALHKPPMPMVPLMHPNMMQPPIHQMTGGHPFDRHDCDCPCHKKMMKKHFENKIDLQNKGELGK